MPRRRNKKPITDHHHIFYPKGKWSKGYLYTLRTLHYCIVPLAKETTHKSIHDSILEIPTPTSENAKEVLRNLYILLKYKAIDDNDSLDKRLRVLIAIFDCVEQPTADALRKQLEIVSKRNKKPP